MITTDNTYVTLANLSGAGVDVVSTVAPALASSYWTSTGGTAASSPAPDPVGILAFSRNEGITDGDVWTFDTTFKVDGVDVSLLELVTGENAIEGSSIQIRMTAGTVDSGWSSTSGSISFAGKSGASYTIEAVFSLPAGALHQSLCYTIFVSMAAVRQIPPVMTNVTTVVMLMLENRSLDNLLGYLYLGSNPPVVVGADTSPAWNGIPAGATNHYHSTPYAPTNGSPSTSAPNFDPGEDFEHVVIQLYGNGNGSMPASPYFGEQAPMSGFAFDYDEVYTTNQQVMGSYSAAQIPALAGLATSYAASDRWFSSIPTQTYANRAFAACGTSLGKVDNSEIDGTTYRYCNTIFNLLGGPGKKTWGVYYQDDGGVAAGSPSGDPFTPYFFPRIAAAANGGVYAYDDPNQVTTFLQALAAGTLPNFCFVEPAWGGGFPPVVIQGTDYHPPTDVGTCDAALNVLWNAIVNSPQWPHMLLIITFDEHGGTYDHQPPPTTTVAPDSATPSPSVAATGFAFQQLGVRVPTILVSPFITAGTVFRTPDANADYDHTSFIATLLKWAGLDPKTAGLGARVAQAPTFEAVLAAAGAGGRADRPQFVDAASDPHPDWSNPLREPTPLGLVAAPRPVGMGDVHEAVAASSTSEEFRDRLQAIRFAAVSTTTTKATTTRKH